MITAVTTMNRKGLDKYGSRMIQSYQQHWPWQVPLRVYGEGFKRGDVDAPLGTPIGGFYDLLQSSPWLSEFKERHKGRPTSDYRMDAVRFAHKVAAITHALQTVSSQFLIWIDADTFTHSDIHQTDLAALLPDPNQWVSWLDRRAMYPECGFVIFNRHHRNHDDYADAFERMYSEDALFKLPEWHDSFVLEFVVRTMNAPRKSISGCGYNTSHPFVNGPLGKWMDHMKGPRKDSGKSKPGDLKVRRTEEYWK